MVNENNTTNYTTTSSICESTIGTNSNAVTSSITNFTNFTTSTNNSVTFQDAHFSYLICFSIIFLIITGMFLLHAYRTRMGEENTINYLYNQEEATSSDNAEFQDSSIQNTYDYPDIHREHLLNVSNKNDNFKSPNDQEDSSIQNTYNNVLYYDYSDIRREYLTELRHKKDNSESPKKQENRRSLNNPESKSIRNTYYNISHHNYPSIRRKKLTRPTCKKDNPELPKNQEYNTPTLPNEATPLSSISNSTIHTIEQNSSKNITQ